MKRIFVPTDFSACSDYAINYAIELAERYKSEIFVVHGFNPNTEIITSDLITPFQGVPGTLSAQQINEFVEERNQYIDKNLSEIEQLGHKKGITLNTSKVGSSVFEDLADQAQDLNCDIVVMGSHGSSGMEEAIVGSNTQKFVRYSKIPVLVIKQPPLKLNDIAFFSTFTEEGEKDSFNRFIKLFNNSQSKMHFVYVNTPSNFLDTPTADKRIQSFLKETKPLNYDCHIYNELSVEEGVSGFSNRNDIDMVVLATHGYTGLRRLFHHSYSESIINHLNVPVLTFSLR
ncbi:MAG: universal stress protein [Bacteroidia bacterium]